MNLDQEIHLRDYLYILRKRRIAMFLFFIMVMGVCVFFTLKEKILYRATATIMIERENPNVVDFKEVMAFDSASTDYYQTQYQMIKSAALVRRLIEEEDLANDPYLKKGREGRLKTFLRSQPMINNFLKTYIVTPSLEDVFIRRMLRVDPIRNSKLVKVSVLHPDPKRAAHLTNRVVDFYIKRSLEDRFAMASQAVTLISDQLVEMKNKVAAAERKLQQYKEENNLVNLPSIRRKDSFIQEAKLELVKLQAEEAKLSKRYLPAHPARIHIRSQIEGLEEKITEEEQKNLEMGRMAIDYAEYEREAESSSQIYESLLKRLQETSSEARSQASNITVVDKAEIPLRPFKPQPVLNFLVAFFIGAFGSFFVAFFLEYLDSTIKIPDDVEKGLGMDLLGIIPESHKKFKGPAKGELLFKSGEHTPAWESFRALRTALLFKTRQIKGCRVFLVTSPNPAEGKSTVTLNLAKVFEQNNLKVLLVDADLRKPRQHKLLGFPRANGLQEVLEKNLPMDQAIRVNVPELGFDFIGAGSASEHPTEILGSEAMHSLLQEWRNRYDVVLLDTPPFLAVADVAVLTDYVDGIIVTTRYQSTDKRHLRNMKRRLNDAGNKILGIVINHVSVREKDYYYHQYYYYGYGEKPPKKK